jgi:predicted acyl esterase
MKLFHFLEPSLGHQSSPKVKELEARDDYWRQGSVCEDLGAVQCPVLLIGGIVVRRC